MYVSCCGVTREKFASFSNEGSAGLRWPAFFSDGCLSGLDGSSRVETVPVIGEISPATAVDDDGSSTFISTSSFFFSSCDGPNKEGWIINNWKPLTVSIASPFSVAAAFSFSLVFSRAFTFAVVERTAVVTLATDSLVGGFVGEGYAKRLGRALETNSNFGAWKGSLVWGTRSKGHRLWY